MTGFYSPLYVVFSILIAILAAYAALDLAGRVTSSRKRSARFAWLACGAVAMGIGIWSMHYIGMLGYRMQMPVLYDWPTVLVSMTAAVLASALALYLASRRAMNLLVTVVGSVFMGGGIAAMHYIGMAAMRMPATSVYSKALVTASIVLAVAISFVALRLTFASRHINTGWNWRKSSSALLMGLAIPVMHYTGMAAVSFRSGSVSAADLRHAISISDLGAASIALVTVVLLCLVFLSAMVDRRFSRHAEEMQDSDQRYRRIIRAAFDAFIGISSDGRVTDWNAQAEATFGWTAEEAIGTSVQGILQLEHPTDSGQTLVELLASVGDTPVQGRVEVVARHKIGTTFPAEMTISEVAEGSKRAFAAFVHDVTERKLAQQSMEEARETAEAANRAKSEFLANMSHEIRTPLNGIIGMTYLALETELTREQREYMDTVNLSADSLLTVINDILDFSKIEAGKVDLEIIRFDLRECIETTLKTLALRADEKGLELLCDIETNVPETVMGDPGRLRQVMLNLIGNAIKFTASGEVALRVSTTDSGDQPDSLAFTVRDTGIGVAPEKLKTIFDSFSQADTSTTRQYGGTGLGLTISKRLVELMQGRVWCESKLRQGSEFHFVISLPPAMAIEPVPVSGAARMLVGVKTLIIDDNKTNRRILEGLLGMWGMNVTSAADGDSALEKIAAANYLGEPYQLVLTDMHMPKMDGFTFVQQMHGNATLAPATVMMLSSGGHRGDASRCQRLGLAAYLLKPVRRDELQEAIVRALGAPSGQGEATMITQNTLQAERSAQHFLNILLAEDNEVNQKLAVRMLQKRGHTVMVAGNGREAVEALVRNRFDLVLMDVQMPEMDGIEATMTIRAQEKGTDRHQAIVAMTALAMKGDRERCLAAEMDGYLSKPIRPLELDAVLESYSERKRRKAAPEAQPEEVDSAEGAVNISELLERIDGDVEFVAELSDTFRGDYPQKLRSMQECLSHGDAEGLRRAAHGLKGALANLAANEAMQLAAKLERIGASCHLSEAPSVLDALHREVPRVVNALDELCREKVL